MDSSHKYYIWGKAACRALQDNDMSFKEFISKLLEPKIYFHKVNQPDVQMPHLKTQYSFLNVGGEFKMDFVGKIENLQNDFDFICDEIGIPRQELPHLNKSKHVSYTDYYDDEAVEIVGHLYKNVIEHFNYNFGD